MMQRKWQELTRACRVALQQDPRDKRVLFKLGTALYYTGDLKGARKHLEAVLEIDPGYGVAHNNLGLVERSEGHLDKAVACFEAASRHGPQLAPPRRNLVVTLFLAGEKQRAKEVFLAQPRWVGQPRQYSGRGEFVLDVDLALFLCDAWLEKHPEDLKQHLDRAEFLARLDRIPEAAAGLVGPGRGDR